jgi:hypothetical protein
MLMTLFATAHTTINEYQKTSDYKSSVSYEVISDQQILMSIFFSNFPDEYAAFKESFTNAFSLRESTLVQEMDNPDIKIGFRKITYLYPSTDISGKPLTLSAAAVWLGYFANGVWNDLKPDNICLMEHYTITNDAETPSNTFALEMFITGNSLTIMPDYIGYGVTKEMTHPYLNHDLCAINSMDALSAGYDLFKEKGKCGMSQNWKLYLLGASQGAANAIAVHKHLDTHPELATQWNFASTYCSSGPYSPVATIDKYLADGKVTYPVVFPMVIKTMFESYPEIMHGFTEDMAYSQNFLAIKPEIDRMIASKEHHTATINQVFFDKVRKTVDDSLGNNEIYLTDILSPDILNKESPICKALFLCLEKNDLTKGWSPVHPIKIHYSLQDKVVPQENTLAILKAFGKGITLEPALSTDHTTTCSLWMLELLNKGL